MRNVIPQPLFLLATKLPVSLYVVGGSVRDHLSKLSSLTQDWDICAPLSTDAFAQIAQGNGWNIKAVYRNTGTVKLQDPSGTDYEYSCFRSDKYVRGVHVPVEIFFTDDIVLDAKRRDFTANAVYYDVQNEVYVDPLQGIPAILEKRFTTVAPAKKVFGEDGLRLMRLARQSAQLGFTPDEECLNGAKQNATLIQDISPERIYAEMLEILTADQKYGVQNAPYTGLKLLEETGVFAHILPELWKGHGLNQRADFHKYDVLEHSLRAVKYASPSIRLAALLHDVGKPLCMLRDGTAYAHPEEGELLTKEILHRLKAPKALSEEICALVKWHMYDFDCKTSEKKLRRFFVQHANILEPLLLLKQADFSACTDDLSLAPTCVRWNNLLKKMHEEHVPFSLKELSVNGKDILALNIPPAHVGGILQQLLLHTAVIPKDNVKERLLKLALGFEKSFIEAGQV